MGVLATLLALILCVAATAILLQQRSKSYVVFANSRAEALELEIDGAPRGAIPPGSSVTVELRAGEHRVVAGDDRGAVLVPPRRFGARGFRGLYNVGAAPGLAVVTKFYAVGPALLDDQVDIVSSGTRFVPLPDSMRADALAVDRAFPEAITVPRGTKYTTVTHVCHLTVRDAEASVGCPGY